VLFAVNVFEVATPFESVVSVSVASGVEVANVPLAPEDGAVNVTETPLAGDPFEVTVAANADPKAEPIRALCGVPVAAVIAMVVSVGPVEMVLLEPQAARVAAIARAGNRKRALEIEIRGLVTVRLHLFRPANFLPLGRDVSSRVAAQPEHRARCES
jgi:hypothetical protein